MTDDEIWEQATAAANEIEGALIGKSSAVAYTALAMVLGEAAARGPKPDFHGMVHAVSACAFGVFNRRIKAND